MSLAVHHTLINSTLNHLTQVRTSGQGQLHFWAGSTGSGRGVTLQTLASIATKDKAVLVVQGSFRESEPPPEPVRRTILELYGTDIFLTAATTIHPLAGLVAQLIAAVMPTREMVDTWRRAGSPTLEDDPLAFRQVLIAATRQRPVLCLLSHFDEVPVQWGSFWVSFISELAQLPLLIVLTLDAPSPLPEPTPSDPDSWKIAYYLCGNGTAQWFTMPPLTRDDLLTLTGAADEAVIEQLWRITKGNPRWSEFLWNAWQTDGVVKALGTGFLGRGPKVWHFTADYQDKPFHPVSHVVGQRLRKLGLTQDQQLVVADILSVGALQGRSFAAPVVIATLQQDHQERNFYPYDIQSDNLIDLLDEMLVADGLLLEELPSPQHPVGVWRYRFASELIWLTVARYGLSSIQKPRLSLKLARHLEALYTLNLHSLAPTLARLFKEGEDIKRAEYYRHLAEILPTTRALLAHCQVLQIEAEHLLTLSTWSRFQELYSIRVAMHLLEEGPRLFGRVSSEYLQLCFNSALTVVQRTGNQPAEGRALHYLGWAIADAGNSVEGLRYMERALSLIKAVGDRKGEGHILKNMGLAWSALGEKQKALEYYEQALLLHREVGDRSTELGILMNIGIIWADLGEKMKGLAYMEQVLPLQREIGDRKEMASTLSNIGAIWSALGEHEKSLEYLEQALPLHREVGGHSGEATTLGHIGNVWSDLGKMEKALEYYEQALLLHREVGDRGGEAVTLHNIGSVWSALGEKQKALKYYEQALPLRLVVKDRTGEAATLHNMASVWLGSGAPQKALEYLERALILQQAVGDRYGQVETYRGLSFVWVAHGNLDQAITAMERAVELQEEVNHPDLQRNKRRLAELQQRKLAE